MKERIITYVKFIVFLGIGGLLLWLVLRDQNIEQVREALRRADYIWIGLSIVLGILSHISRAYRWNMLIHPLGYRPKIYNTFFAVMIGYFANLAFPRLGEVSKCGVLNRYEKIPVNRLLGTMIIERAVDLITLLSLSFLVFITEFEIIGNFFEEYVITGIAEKIGGNNVWLIVIGLVGLLVSSLFLLFSQKIKATKPYIKVVDLVAGIWDGIKGVRNIENKSLFIFHSVLIWGLYYLMTYVAFFAFDATDHLGFEAGLAILVLGSFGMVAPVQGGIGAYHFMVSETMQVYAIAEEPSLAFAFAVHAAQTFMIIIFGFLSLILLPVVNANRNEQLQVELDTAEGNPTEGSQ